jgi:hypothetical protein
MHHKKMCGECGGGEGREGGMREGGGCCGKGMWGKGMESGDMGGGCMFYIIGVVGAAIYFVSTATSFFWMGALGLLKAMVWPAFIVFELLKFLGV